MAEEGEGSQIDGTRRITQAQLADLKTTATSQVAVGTVYSK